VQIGKILKNNRRKASEFLGLHKYSKLGLNGLDDKLAKYLNFKGGFFVEAGACDGLFQSNTYYLEKALGWDGILIEPIWEQFVKCTKNRQNCELHRCLLGKKPGSEIIHSAGAMSISESSYLDIEKHIKDGLKVQHLKPSEVEKVPVKTLSEIIGNRKVDFFSLDIEGGELDALKGLGDADIDYILVETDKPDEVQKLIPDYEFIDKLTFHDYLFKKI